MNHRFAYRLFLNWFSGVYASLGHQAKLRCIVWTTCTQPTWSLIVARRRYCFDIDHDVAHFSIHLLAYTSRSECARFHIRKFFSTTSRPAVRPYSITYAR